MIKILNKNNKNVKLICKFVISVILQREFVNNFELEVSSKRKKSYFRGPGFQIEHSKFRIQNTLNILSSNRICHWANVAA